MRPKLSKTDAPVRSPTALRKDRWTVPFYTRQLVSSGGLQAQVEGNACIELCDILSNSGFTVLLQHLSRVKGTFGLW